MQLHFKSFGSGTPLIILHGMLGMLDNWQSFAKILGEGYMIYLLDQRNHGKSPHHNEMTYPLMAEDLRETMEAQWLYDGAILIGHSMGGKTAMQLALAHPDLVNALIIIDIAPVAYPATHEEILETLSAIAINDVSDRHEVHEMLRKRIDDAHVVSFLMKNLLRRSDGAYEWKMNLKVITKNYQHMLAAPTFEGPAFKGPTLFIKGSESNYITPDGEKRISTWFPESQVVTIQNAGHWVHADNPAGLKKIVHDFLNEVREGHYRKYP